MPPASSLVIQFIDDPQALRPSPSHYVVTVRADRLRPVHHANAIIVQNPTQHQPAGHQPRFYLPHYPAQGLLPRDPARGDQFRVVSFFGEPQNLAPPLAGPEFRAWMNAQGLELQVRTEPATWHDYAQVDAVLALRDLDGAPHHSKPATKLYNAWHARVPAILGPESAYRWHRRSDLDYLEATTLDDVKAALLRLRDDPALRSAMATNSARRAQDHTQEATTEQWRVLLEEELLPRASRWLGSPTAREWHAGRAKLDEWRRRLAPPSGRRSPK